MDELTMFVLLFKNNLVKRGNNNTLISIAEVKNITKESLADMQKEILKSMTPEQIEEVDHFLIK